jgi:hypothetical protein
LAIQLAGIMSSGNVRIGANAFPLAGESQSIKKW